MYVHASTGNWDLNKKLWLKDNIKFNIALDVAMLTLSIFIYT